MDRWELGVWGGGDDTGERDRTEEGRWRQKARLHFPTYWKLESTELYYPLP